MKPFPKLAAAIFAGALAINSVPAQAQVDVHISLRAAPPPSRHEVVPAARQGYVWAPGYWNWNGNRHVWSAGHWERARAGQQYERAEWRQDGEKWKLKKGGWKRVKRDGKHDNGVGYKGDKDDKYDKYDKFDKGKFCPPGQAKKGNC